MRPAARADRLFGLVASLGNRPRWNETLPPPVRDQRIDPIGLDVLFHRVFHWLVQSGKGPKIYLHVKIFIDADIFI